MNQSELEANTCNRRQARENACERVGIGLILPLTSKQSNARRVRSGRHNFTKENTDKC